jgi:SnoaL-like domain
MNRAHVEVPGNSVLRISPGLLCRLRSECQQLVATAFWLGDSRADEAYAECFTPDGVLDRAGDLVRGREALAQYIRQRPRTVVVRHFNSMPVITAYDRRHLSCLTLSTVCRWDGDATPTIVRADVVDDCVLTAEGWRISLRKAQPCGG